MSKITLKDVIVEFPLRENLKGAVGAKYGIINAIDGVSLEISSGDKVGLIGRNGAGKSTLLKVLSGLLPPTKGQISISGPVQPALSIKSGLIGNASCLENAKMRAFLDGFSTADATAYSERVMRVAGLEKFKYQPIKTLSSGMLSRLLIAMFLTNEMPIITFDEWVGVLDKNQLEGGGTLKQLIDSSEIVVMASHLPRIITRYCNRCLVLKDGKIEFDGGTDEALQYYASQESGDLALSADNS